MMLDIRRLVLILIATMSAPYIYGSSSQAVAQESGSTSKLGSISGRVLAEGQAVTTGSVTVSSVTSPRQTRAVPTNDNGDFEVKGLEPGMYRVQVSAPAFVTASADNDQEIYRIGDSVTLNMIKGGVITGKVANADNDPIVAVRVRALMIRDSTGRRRTSMEPSADRLTDDRGVYRIFGLLPGTYVVFAGGRGFSGTGANAYDNDAPTFAPSSTRDTAEEISLASGEERTVDIRYRANTGHAVSGNVNAPTTTTSPWIPINLVRVVNSTPEFKVLTFQRAGTKGFDFQGVADGEYLVWAEYTAGAGERLVSEPKRITVRGADVTGIELNVKPLASVAGVVALETSAVAECKDKRRPLFDETLVSLQRNQRQAPKGEPARDQSSDPPYYDSSQTSPDTTGRFELRNLAGGQYNFNLRSFARYWYLRSVTLSGSKDAAMSDVARHPLTLKSGDRVRGLKAILAEGAASISGRVELPEDRRAGRVVFFLFPAEKEKADDVLRYFAAPVADDGSFTMDQLSPGRYWTIAKTITTENESNTAALRLPATAATRAKLRREAEAANSDLELKPCQTVRNHQVMLAAN